MTGALHSALFRTLQVDYLFASGGTYAQNPAAWDCYVQYIRGTSADWNREKTNLLGARLGWVVDIEPTSWLSVVCS